MDLKIIGEIFNKIQEERIKQNAKWGEQNHSLVNWVAILTEEVGEVAKEAVDWVNLNPFNDGTFARVAANKKIQDVRLENYEKELIQTAAVCVQMLESLYRNEKNTRVNVRTKAQHETFNSIADIRQFLLSHPDQEMVKESCLHYLGDDHQKLNKNQSK